MIGLTWKSRFTRLAYAAIVLSVAGCSGYELNERALDFNAALSDNDNRQVLLNGARASKHYPLYFTTISKVTSSGQLQQASLGFSIPFGPAASKAAATVSPAIQLQEGFSVDTSPLNTQEFFEGFLQPISFSIFDYYLQYDWDPELIYYAFIRRITISYERATEIAALAAKTRAAKLSGTAKETCLRSVSDPFGAWACFGDQIPNADILGNAPCPGPDASSGFVRFTNSPTQRCEFARFQLLIAELRMLNFSLVSFSDGSDQGEKVGKTGKKAKTDDKSKDDSSKDDSTGNDQSQGDAKGPDYYAELELWPQTKKGDKLAEGGCQLLVENKGAAKAKTLFPLSSKALQSVEQALDAADRADKAAERLRHIPANTSEANTLRNVIADRDKLMRKFQRRWAVGNRDFNTFVCATAEVPPIVLRSPEGIVFYIGEIIRAENSNRKEEFRFTPKINIGDRRASARLLLVCRSTPYGSCSDDDVRGKPIVSVSMDGAEYFIPRSASEWPDQSMHFVTLLEQILALQKKASTLPTTPTVRVIGP